MTLFAGVWQVAAGQINWVKARGAFAERAGYRRAPRFCIARFEFRAIAKSKSGPCSNSI
jgi:hypothetical protein